MRTATLRVDLRAVNARLRQVVADKDELIAVHEQLLAADRERSPIQDALVSGQAAQIAKQDEILRVQAAQIEAQAELVKRLSDEVAELKRRSIPTRRTPHHRRRRTRSRPRPGRKQRGRCHSGNARPTANRAVSPDMPARG